MLLPLALTKPGLLGFLGGTGSRAATVALAPTGEVRAKRGRTAGSRWAAVCLTVAFAAVLLTLAAVPAAEGVASVAMSDRGYVRCPAPPAERRAPMRWTRSGGHCP